MNILIGVGGTGQHAAIAYLHLARLANFRPEPIVIIDNDGNAETMTTLNRLKLDFWPVGNDPGGRISPFPDDLIGDTPREVFHGEEPSGLLNLVLERYPRNPERGSEQDAYIKKGYYAFPQLGAIFAQALFHPMSEDNPVRKRILTPLHTAGSPRRVGISGSIVGGCGSGVIPQLVDAIDAFQSEKRYSDRQRIRVQTLTNLVTFVLEGNPPLPTAGDPTAAADTRRITEQIMRENATSGLVYFREKLTAKSDRFILIANPHGQDKRTNDGHRNARETPDYYHVLQATLQHLFFNASDARIPLIDPSERIRIFSSGEALISPRLLPVPSEELLDFSRRKLPLDNFEESLSDLDLRLNGEPLTRLLPRCSLHKWMWVSRIQVELGEHCLQKLSGERISIHFDFRDQLRHYGILTGAADVLREERAKTIASLEWMRAAFWQLNVQPEAVRPAVDPDLTCWEMLPQQGINSWRSGIGARLRRDIENIDLAPKGFFEPWRNNTEWNPASAGRELYMRCRRLAEDLVDGIVREASDRRAEAGGR